MRIHRLWSGNSWGWSLIVLTAFSRCTTARDIEARELESRAFTSECPNSYTSNNGMNFTMYCNQNDPWNDALAPFITNSMQECMEHCSRYWGNSEGCYGVVWNQNSTYCWMKNSTTSTANLYTEIGSHSALVPRSDLQGVSTTCPYDDLSVQTLNSGEGFTIHCDKVIAGYDLCFDEYPECLPAPFIGYWHADSLQECMRLCADSHPLCMAVSWSPAMNIGFANCWPKTGFVNGINDASIPSGLGIVHTAAVTSIETINTTCPSDKSYSTNGKTFDINCGQVNSGTNISSIHRANLTSCMDACANNHNGCVGILFDSTLQGGFQNCYLQNTTSVVKNDANTTFALLSGTPIPTSKPTGTNSPSSSGGTTSKAWIAGPVIGGIVVVAVLIGAFLWWRRRATKSKRAYSLAPPSNRLMELGTVETGQAKQAYSLASPNNHPMELDSSLTNEMGTMETGQAYGSQDAKYGHSPALQPPQELPT